MFKGKSLGKAGDQTANQFLVHALREQRPEDGVGGELIIRRRSVAGTGHDSKISIGNRPSE